MDKLTKEKNRNLSFFSSESSESSEFSPSRKTVSSHNSPILTAEAFDYRGKPLQPCWTPFPRSNPSKSNRKANESKKKKKNSKESTSSSSGSSFIKPPVPPVSDSSSSFVSTASFQSNKSKKSKESSPIQLKRVSSDTKFPCARSPATRKKMRKLLKEYAEKKVKKQKETAEFHSREDANLANILKGMIKEKKKPEDTEEKKTNDSEEKSITSTSSSMKTIYSKRSNLN
uniref:Uncharacterized protein n=1 Tax=Caenorhabditis tropicalis TaxID=1561998 RepID=A0A1I7U493_9PELO